MEKLMVVGGHSGDEAVMAGPIVARLIREGGSAVFVSLTNGNGGHHTLTRAEYAPQKEREAKAAAARLGAECVLFPISSGMLEVSPERERELASLIRRYTPDTLLTHWKDSIHRDHIAAHHISVSAIRLAASAAFEDGQAPHRVSRLVFGDNWEDAENFRAEEYITFTEEDEAVWLSACCEFEFFREGFYAFDYRRYYEALHRMRGALAVRSGAKMPLAVAVQNAPRSYYAITVN
jgi:LmbE family N-acetylglucosaminyl deacetylase